MAYFDWNATAPLHPAARAAWLEAVDRYWANSSTAYRLGTQARVALEEARETVAGYFDVDPMQVVFTSGATEANNGLIREMALGSRPDGDIWISAVEHPSVRVCARQYWGHERVREMPVGRDGVLDLEWFRERLQELVEPRD